MRFWTERLPFLDEFARGNKVLHIGAGRETSFGTTLDISPDVGADLVADLNEPLAIPDNSFDAVYAYNILEHLPGLVPVMTELHRVVKPGGFISLLMPHFSAAATHIDPTHVRGASVETFDYFIEGTSLFADYDWYSSVRFRLQQRLLMLESPYANAALGKLVNRRAELFEKHWCYIIRAGSVYFELEVV